MIDEDKWFRFTHGKKASSLQELRHVIEELNEAEFRHHVNDERNDFAKWVEDVFEQKKLAKSMRKARDKEELIKTLDAFLKKKHKQTRSEEKKVIAEEQESGAEVEKALSEKEIRSIVNEAKQELEKEEKHISKHEEDASSKRLTRPGQHHRMIVKEFIFGFVLGLIFGLIMLGIIANLR